MKRWLLFLLLVVSAPAYAHGAELIIFLAMVYGIGFGVVGGVANGILRKEKVLGLVLTVALYFLAGLAFALYDTVTGEPIPGVAPTPLYEIAFFSAGLQTYGGLVPLVVSFFCSHFLVRFVKGRLK